MKHKSLIQNTREKHFLRTVKQSETREIERKKRAQHYEGNFECQYKSFYEGWLDPVGCRTWRKHVSNLVFYLHITRIIHMLLPNTPRKQMVCGFSIYWLQSKKIVISYKIFDHNNIQCGNKQTDMYPI